MVVHKISEKVNKEQVIRVYLCNQAVRPKYFRKYTFKWKDVTCKNCLKQKPQETSKIRDEEELQFLQLIINEHRDLICCNEECWCWKIDNRIEEIKRRKEE